MKDIVITGKKLRNELFIILGCFIAACLLNVYAIIKYSRPVSELITMIGFVIAAAVLIYVALLLVRIVVAIIVYIIKKCLNR